ncbi:MAG: hypothetical protein R2748_17085 [Bryobacterales bacterium]
MPLAADERCASLLRPLPRNASRAHAGTAKTRTEAQTQKQTRAVAEARPGARAVCAEETFAPSEGPPPIPEPEPWKEGHFTSAVYRNSAGVELTYQLYMPAACERPCPLVLYLHSASGRGDDNETNINGSRRWGASFWTSDEVQQRHPRSFSSRRPIPGSPQRGCACGGKILMRAPSAPSRSSSQST